MLRLWRGALPLEDAFFTWVVIVGVLLNAASTAGFFLLLQAGQGVLAALVGYVLSLSYNLVATVGLWRSAARHTGPAWQARAARWATAALMLLLSIT